MTIERRASGVEFRTGAASDRASDDLWRHIAKSS